MIEAETVDEYGQVEKIMSPVKLLGVITWHECESYCYGFSLYHCKLNNNSDFKNKHYVSVEDKMTIKITDKENEKYLDLSWEDVKERISK